MTKLKLKTKSILTLFAVLAPALFYTNQTNAYKVQSFQTPNPSSIACGLAISSDSNIWFVKPQERKIVRSDSSGNMVEFNIPQINQLEPDSYPSFCSVSPDSAGGILFTSNDRGATQDTKSGYIRKVTSDGQIDATLVTVPTTSTNNSITPSRVGLFGLKHINDSTYWVTGGSLEDGYTIVMKVNQAGEVLDYWESNVGEGGGPFASVMDSNNNLWVALRNEVVKISPDGQESTIQLNNIDGILALVSDGNNDIWVFPAPYNYTNTTTPVAKINHTNNDISYFQLPEGKTLLPLQAASIGPDGSMWIGTMDSGGQGAPQGLALSRLSLAGVFTQTDIISTNQATTSLKLDKSNSFWALTTDLDADSDEVFIPNSVKLLKINLDGTIPQEPPKPPKTGNTAIFIVISSLVVTSALLFSTYLHRKHLKTKAATK